MSLKLVFRIFAVVQLINALGFGLFSNTFLEMAGFTVTDSLITLSQAMGTALLGFGVIAWRSLDIAGDSLSAYGQVVGIVNSLFVLLIGYHILSGQIAGPTAYGNMVATIVLAALFFTQSKK